MEASFFALVDGENVLPLASAQDHKRVGDKDTGPNTGGMGAYSPAPAVTDEITNLVMDKIVLPTVAGMKADGKPYHGVLYAGLMLTNQGPKLIEYNVRFGDPECQVLMTRLMSDLVPALIATCDGELKDFDLRWFDEAALTVVMASNGYPSAYEKGSVINGLRALVVAGALIFHAGTGTGNNGEIVALGGRVLNVTANGSTIAEAQGHIKQWTELTGPAGSAGEISAGGLFKGYLRDFPLPASYRARQVEAATINVAPTQIQGPGNSANIIHPTIAAHTSREKTTGSTALISAIL